jgi:hypothetical protein
MCDDAPLFESFCSVQYLLKVASSKQRLEDAPSVLQTLDLPLVGTRAPLKVLNKYRCPGAHYFLLIPATEFRKTMRITGHHSI